MGKKCDLSDFDRGMIVGARQGGLSISETADLLGFSCTTGSRVGRNALLMREVRREGPNWSKLTGRSQ